MAGTVSAGTVSSTIPAPEEATSCGGRLLNRTGGVAANAAGWRARTVATMIEAIARRVRAAGRAFTASPQGTLPPTENPSRRAVIIDLDNIGVPARGNAGAVLTALLGAAGDYDVVVASGRDCSFAAYGQACTQLGIVAFESPAIRDGADRALLAAAAALDKVGVTEFVVMSGDHIFARLPGTVRVVARSRQPISSKLLARATSVSRVELPKPSARCRPDATAPVTVSPVTISPVTISPVTISPVTISPVTISPVTISPVTAPAQTAVEAPAALTTATLTTATLTTATLTTAARRLQCQARALARQGLATAAG